jgi:hypothetical protein
MKSRVYFANLNTKHGYNLLDKVSKLFRIANFNNIIKENDYVAIKLHWGEYGNLSFVPPQFLRRIVEEVKNLKAKPFLTDTNTLYRGGRANAIDNIYTAYKNGFSIEASGAPIIIADGLCGLDYVKVSLNGKHVKEAKIGSSIYHANSIIFVTHFKGHELFGFGGAIKNVGMGCASSSGKQILHSDVKPSVNREKCIGCRVCIKWCPAGAITIDNMSNKANIVSKVCIGCGECVVLCSKSAISINWEENELKIQEKTAEYALAVLSEKEDRVGFFNFLINISPNCDCYSWNNIPIVSDIGILASVDPVAIDQASVDLVNNLVNRDIFKALNKEWRYMLIHSEKIGLGSREYELINID